jgi:DNA-binding response OmpR family regulator
MTTGKILIVDDDPGICESMTDLLDLKDYQIIVAHNGVDGLKICAQQVVDLIILDLNMPRMDGYMFMERLNERWKSDHKKEKMPKIMVLTAVDKQTDLGLATNLGASKFMNKPFRTNEFINTVEKLMGE